MWLTGEVGVDFTFAQLQSSLTAYANNGDGIPTLNLYSHGGYLNDATAFYDWAVTSNAKFRVRVWGTAMSAMTLIAAAAGRENIEIAPNATWMIHECHGGTDEMNAHGNDAAVRIYRRLTNLTEKKIREMMAATTTLNAQQAVEMGFAGKVMKNTMKLAAMYEAKPIELNEQLTAMADKKTTVPVKLTFGKAISAAFGSEVTAEVDVDQAVADEIATLKEENAALKGQIAALETAQGDKQADEAADQEAITDTEKEAVTAKADLETAKAEHAKELEKVKAAHLAELAALKAPLASKTVADNQAPAVGAMPGTDRKDDPNISAIKAALKGTSDSAKVTQNKATA